MLNLESSVLRPRKVNDKSCLLQEKKFSLTIAEYQINPYLCSPMRYLNKPSEKIITTESTGSTKLNFLLFHIDGHIVDRLFFANINKLNR